MADRHGRHRKIQRLPAGRDAVSRQFVVGFEEEAWGRRDEFSSMLEERGVKSVFDIEDLRARVFRVPQTENSSAPIVAELDKVKGKFAIRYVERNQPVRLLARPDDPLFDEQWAWRQLEAESAWKRVQEAGDVIVAVVDSGIDIDHEDLQSEFWENADEKQYGQNQNDDDGNGVIDDINGARFTVEPPDGDVRDRDGHGTLLAGTIGAVTDNAKGGAGGASPVKLMAVAFFDALTWPTGAAAARAILYAVRQHAAIINASWDVGFDIQVLREAVQFAEQAGVLVVAAAGNTATDNDRFPTYPASYPFSNVISVLATDENDERAWFSNFGEKKVHLGAPGVQILSTYPYFLPPPRPTYVAYRYFSGTSPAAAHVAGAAALLKHLNPGWTPADLREHLMASVDGVQALRRQCASGGRLNYRRAIVGPLGVLSPGAGNKLPQGAIINVVWRSEYQTKACQTVSIKIRDNSGPWMVLATNVKNHGVYRVALPHQAMSQAQIKLTGEQGNFFDLSERFVVM